MSGIFNELVKRMTTPLVSKEMIAPAQDAIDAPTADRGVGEAQVRGFAAGAMDGARDFTSPLSLLTMLAGGSGARGLAKVASALRGGKAAAKVATAGASDAAAVLPAEFAAVGEEAAHNAPRIARMADEAARVKEIARAGDVMPAPRVPAGGPKGAPAGEPMPDFPQDFPMHLLRNELLERVLVAR